MEWLRARWWWLVPTAWLIYKGMTLSHGFFSRDEAFLEALGWRLSRGERLYQEVSWLRTPLSPWIHELLALASMPAHGQGLLLAHRWLWVGQYLLMLSLAASALRSAVGRPALASLPLLLIPLFHSGDAPNLTYDWDGLTFATLSFWFASRARQSRRPGLCLLAAGSAGALAFLAKQGFLFAAAGTASYCVLVAIRSRRLRSLGLFLAGFSSVVCVAVAVLHAQGLALSALATAVFVNPRLTTGYSFFDAFFLVHLPVYDSKMIIGCLGVLLASLGCWRRSLALSALGASILALQLVTGFSFYSGLTAPLYLLCYGGLGLCLWQACRRRDPEDAALALFCLLFQYGATFNFNMGAYYAVQGFFLPLGYLFAKAAARYDRLERPALLLPLAVVAALALQNDYQWVYGDASRDKLTAVFHEPVLAGLRSTPERVTALEGMFGEVRRQLGETPPEPGSVWFAIDNMFGYIALGIRPPTVFTSFYAYEVNRSDFLSAFAQLQKAPPRVLVTDHYWQLALTRITSADITPDDFGRVGHWIQARYRRTGQFTGWRSENGNVVDQYDVWTRIRI